ncbi:MAG: hypothetical protein R3324_00580, partial [Halobacteriales archaeon]|nr:hypothetical protein [Halobacteriales archaeon]
MFSRSEIELIQSASATMLSVLDHPDAETWADAVMADLRPLLEADRMLLVLPTEDWFVLRESDEDLTTAQAAYSEFYYQHDYHTQQRRRELGVKAFNFEMVVRPDERRTSIVWNDFNRHFRLLDPIGIAVDIGPTDVPSCVMAYREHAGGRDFGRRGRAILDLLVPSWESALQMARYVEHRAEDVLTCLDAVAVPSILMDGRRMVLHANPAFGSMPGLAAFEDDLVAAARRLAGEVLSRTTGHRTASQA